MSYNSKRTIVSMAAGILLAVAYIIYALGDHAPALDNVKAWAIALLVFLGIGIAVTIVIMILFHIGFAIGIAVKQRSEKGVERMMAVTVAEDERDKLIGYKSARIGRIAAAAGFIAALVVLAFGMPVVAALHILFGACAAGGITEGIVSVYFYERGV